MKTSRYLILLVSLCLISVTVSARESFDSIIDDDNEFASFDDNEIDAAHAGPDQANVQKGSEPEIEQQDIVNDFEDATPETKQDSAEFDKELESEEDAKPIETEQVEMPKLQFADIPEHLRSNWFTYKFEILIIVAMVIYGLNYGYGSNANSNIAFNWFNANLPYWHTKYALVADNGVSDNLDGDVLLKITDNLFQVFCSGKTGYENMLTQLRLNKRQDLIGTIIDHVQINSDSVVQRNTLCTGELDQVVFCCGNRTELLAYCKTVNDLSTFATIRSTDKLNLPRTWAVMAEINEYVTTILDSNTVEFLRNNAKYFNYIHISESYTGTVNQEGAEVVLTLPEKDSVVIVSMNLIDQVENEVVNEEINRFIDTLTEKARKLRLSKEGRAKTEKNRVAAEATFYKQTHALRQEKMQERRDDKIRSLKQKIEEETDPEKQRKLAKAEEKREAKSKAPKVKTLKTR
uniref:Coiled-coil domain-containing protein 47 n=1 Tax=Rhabditophanes sp. KR3021 TaxID=114890 RepID=A0AC35TU72_9BILA